MFPPIVEKISEKIPSLIFFFLPPKSMDISCTKARKMDLSLVCVQCALRKFPRESWRDLQWCP